MMSFRLHLKKMKTNQSHTRIKLYLEKLKDPDVVQVFEARIGGKFAPLLLLDADGTDADTFIDTIITAVTETTNEVLDKKRTTKKPWVTPDLLKLCDERRDLKQFKFESDEGADKYRQADKQVKKSMLKAKKDY
jgi:DNA-binding ferritin-like protein (Dps family)